MMKSVINTAAQLKRTIGSCLHDSTESHKICFMGLFFCALVIILTCGLWSVIQTDRELRLNLLAETQNLADEIKPWQIEMLSGTIVDIDSPFYLQLKEQLSAVRSVNPNCQFVYLLGRRPDNTVFIFGDSEPANSQDYSPPGQIYKEATADCANIFTAKTKIVEGPEQDRWGVWVSGLVPIINQKTGEVIAVLGMDIDAQTWKSELIYAAIPYALFALIIILIFIFNLIQKLHKRCQYGETIIPVTIGVTLTTAIGLLVNTNEQRHNRDAFFLLANSQAMRISEVFHDLEQTELEGLASFFENSDEVTRSKFNTFVEFLSRNPAIQAWEWIPAVTSSERVHFEQEIRRTELPEFMIWQKDDKGNKIPAQNETTYPVLYLSPIPGNEQAFGYDLGSEKTRRAALMKAEQMRCTIGSDPVSLVQETVSEKGLLVFHPVFKTRDSQHLRGFALAVLQMETLLRNTIDSQADSGVVMNLFELHAKEPRQKLASTENSRAWVTPKSAVQFNRPLMAFGKTFLLSASPYKTFLETHPNRMGLVITIAGLIITAAITILIKLIANRQKELERLVDERTSTLQASEERIQLILNSTAEAIYGLDINGNCTFCNNSCLRLLGYARPEDLLGKNMHAQIHSRYPDGSPFPMELCQILKAFQHGEEIHVEEDIFWRSDGTSFPVEYWSYPQRRDNSLIGAVVTFLDITERKQSKEKLEQHVALIDSLLDSIPDIVFFKTLNGTYSGCNPAFCEFVGKTRDSIIGRTDYDLFSQEIADSFRENDRVMLKLCQPRLNEEWIAYPDGRERLVDTLKTPHWGPDRKVVGILGISRDITKRKAAENALKELNDSLESEVEKRTAEVYKANLAMRDEIMLRRQAENALRYRLYIEGAVSQASKTFLGTDDADINSILRILGNTVSAHRAYIFEFDSTLLKMDNTYEWCSPSVQPQKENLQNIETSSLPWWMSKMVNNEIIVIADIEQMPPEAAAEQCLLKSQDIRSLLVVPMVWSSGKLAGFLGFDDTAQCRTWLEEDIAALKIVAEITILYWERKKATEESLVYESQLSALSSRLQQMLEDERKKISREIHDELGTILTVLKFDISSLAKAIPESSNGLHDKIRSISTTIDTTIKLVQDICTELRPDLIDNMGLTDEIEWYASEFSRRTGIKYSLELPEAFELEPDRSIAVFRIFQELLTNVARHAKATSLDIRLCIKDNILELTITDDGCGINPKQTVSARSLGLIGIRERIKFLNGHFEIAGNAVRGTTAKLTIVLTGNDKDDKSNDL